MDTYRSGLDLSGSTLGPPAACWAMLRTPAGMETNVTSATEPAMTPSELAAYL